MQEYSKDRNNNQLQEQEYLPPPSLQNQFPKQQYSQSNYNGGNDCIRVYITLKASQNENGDWRKLILMVPINTKISMMKRMVEQEFADLFPNEPTFICAKLQDQYGYSLSNSSLVYELLQNGDRLFAIPESFSKEMGNVMHLTSDIQELLYLLRSIQTNIAAKMTEISYNNIENIEDVLASIIPLGFFGENKHILHNVAQVLRKVLETERLHIFEEQKNQKIRNIVVTVLNFWITDLIYSDNFLLSQVVDVLDILIKSASFSMRIKQPQIINNLMNVSKLEFVSAQTRSRIIKIISYLTKGEFKDSFNPRPVSRGFVIELQRNDQEQQQKYVPSFQQNDNNSKKMRPSSIRQDRQRQQQQQDYQLSNETDSRIRQGNSQLNRMNQEMQLQQQQSSNQHIDQNQENNRQFQKPSDYAPYLSNSQKTRVGPNPQAKLHLTNPLKIQNDNQNGQDNYYQGNQEQQQQQFTGYYNGEKNNNEPAYTTMHNQLMKDYVSLLVPESTQEMYIFAVQNLEPVMQDLIHYIMDNRESYLKMLNLLEITLPYEQALQQMKILDTVTKHLNADRAFDGLKQKLVQRILSAFKFQPSAFQPILYNMLQKHLQLGDFQVDVLGVMQLVDCPYDRLQTLGMKIMTVISDPNKAKFTNYDAQFENFVKQLIDYTFTRERTHEFVNYTLQTLSNLCLKDSLRAQIVYNKGVETFLAHLRNESNVDGQRIAAKALLNMTISSRELKMKIVGELTEEIKRMHRNELDSIVHGYLQTLLVSKDNSKYVF